MIDDEMFLLCDEFSDSEFLPGEFWEAINEPLEPYWDQQEEVNHELEPLHVAATHSLFRITTTLRKEYEHRFAEIR
jgi:hypothetical protein